MWILKNSTSLLLSVDQLDVRTATSVQTFDFSTLYTSIPYDLLKSRISNLVHNGFRKKDGSVRYTHIKVTRTKGCFTHDINDGRDGMYTADNIWKMIEFLIDNIFVQFGGRLFRQMIGTDLSQIPFWNWGQGWFPISVCLTKASKVLMNVFNPKSSVVFGNDQLWE